MKLRNASGASADLGVDTGGTFTDLATLDPASGLLTISKVPSTPGDPSEAIRTLLAGTRGPLGRLVHGTTVATNTLLEKAGAGIAVVTTRGFRDTLEIGSTRRASPGLFDTKFVKPAPLVPRSLRFEIDERIASDGSVLVPLDAQQLANVVDRIGELQPDVVVVCLIHAYANPEHERRVREVVGRRMPDCPVVISSEIVPEYREFERLSTTAINGYTLPKMAGYLRRLSGHVRDHDGRDLYVMSSNGGIMSSNVAASFPARTILSGPAGGVRGATLIAESAGIRNLLTCDMGGTSTDVSLIRDLDPDVVQVTMIAGLPLKIAQLDINTVGAGGGSIAWVDVDGTLRVGPKSAGASPGPACYGQGGESVTVTDANLFLGRLGTDSLLGGGLHLRVELAKKALESLSRAAHYSDLDRLADGVIQLVVANMVGALREISLQRGHDPREFVLFPFGGAGPLHAVDIAREMGMSKIIVPRFPGNLSAIGLLNSDIRYDLARTLVAPLAKLDLSTLGSMFDELDREGRDALTAEGFDDRSIRIERTIDMRYLGQAHALSVAMPAAFDRDILTRDFEAQYRRRYGFCRPGHAIEAVVLRATAVGQVPKHVLPPIRPHTGQVEAAVKARRPVYFRGRWFRDCAVYEREALGAGVAISGPAIVEEFGSTTALPPDAKALVDGCGNLCIET